MPRRPGRPDPDRPVVALDFRLEDDLRTVTGTEAVIFTPTGRPASWCFGSSQRRRVRGGGNRLVVDDVRGGDVRRRRVRAAGAADPGGLYVVALDDGSRRGSRPGSSWTSRSRLGRRLRPPGHRPGRVLVGQRRPAVRLGAGGRLGAGSFRRRVCGETASSPVADVTLACIRPRAADRPDDRRPGPASEAWADADLDVGEGRPRRRRGGGGVRDAERRRRAGSG